MPIAGESVAATRANPLVLPYCLNQYLKEAWSGSSMDLPARESLHTARPVFHFRRRPRHMKIDDRSLSMCHIITYLLVAGRRSCRAAGRGLEKGAT